MQKYLSKFETLLYWQVLVLLVFVPLYMKFPMFSVQGTFVAIRMEDLLIAFTFITWIGYILLSKKIKSFFQDGLNFALIAFFIIGAVSTFSAIFLTKTAQLNLGALHFLRRVEMMMLLPIAATAIKSRRQVIYYLSSLSLVVFLVNFYALGQRYLRFPAISTINSELSKGLLYYLTPADRIVSTFAGHYDLAIFLLISIILLVPVIFFLIDSKKIKGTTKKQALFLLAWFGFLTLFSGLILVMTAARLSFIAVIFGVLSVLILLKKGKFILVFMAVLIAFSLYPSNLRDRFISTFTINIQRNWKGYITQSEEQQRRSGLNIPTLPATGEQIKTVGTSAADIVPGEPTDITELAVYRSFAIRLNEEWPRAIRAFWKNPLLGTGYSSLGLAIDNDILRSLGEVGILGTFAFLLVLVEIIKRTWVQYRKAKGFYKYFFTGILSMIIALVLNSLFIDVFEASKIASLFWILVGISIGLSKLNLAKK